jgi:phosphatidylinositol alpha-1,6-mannosyltransferase
VSPPAGGRVDKNSAASTPHSERIIGLFPELLGVGGVQEAGRQTAAALHEIARDHGQETQFFSLNDPAGEHVLPSGALEIPFRGFGRAKVQFIFAAALAARNSKGVVLAAHPNMALPAALMKKLSPRLKTIVVSHGVEVWQPLPCVRRAALRRANLLLAPSRYTVRKLNEVQGIPIDKIRRLPWPLSPAFLSLAEASETVQLPLEFPSGKVILTVGRWAASERYKGADDLIVAVAQLRPKFPNLHLVLIGQGDDLVRLQTLAAEVSATDTVHFIQGISREGLAACYARADIFALPSTGEGFGLVFLEAMAFGKPIVAAAAGGATDLVENDVNGLLVPANNPEQLANALARLLNDEALRLALGRRGLEKIHSQHSFDRFESGLDNTIRDLT